jgi:RNA polymerase sigma factor (sigma-70 family)
VTPAAELLVIEHMWLVARIAKRAGKRLPSWIELDDLLSDGYVGLVEAAGRFDPARHASFAAYATARIRGAILDAYRGRNYPRLTEALADDYDQIDERPTAEELLIARQEEQRLRKHVRLAKRCLDPLQKRTIRQQLSGKSLRDIGANEGRCASWAHGVVHSARRKLKVRLSDYEPARA